MAHGPAIKDNEPSPISALPIVIGFFNALNGAKPYSGFDLLFLVLHKEFLDLYYDLY